MKGYTDMVEMTQKLTPKGKHYINRIKMAVENKTPEEIMLDTINSERYSKITL